GPLAARNRVAAVVMAAMERSAATNWPMGGQARMAAAARRRYPVVGIGGSWVVGLGAWGFAPGAWSLGRGGILLPDGPGQGALAGPRGFTLTGVISLEPHAAEAVSRPYGYQYSHMSGRHGPTLATGLTKDVDLKLVSRLDVG